MWNWELQYLIITISLCPSTPYIYKNFTQVRWVDQIMDPEQRDSFFDRVVMVVLNETVDSYEVYMNNHTLIAPGVLINEDTVLTSYNPFRKIIKDKERRKKIVVAFLDHRILKNYEVSYEIDFETIDCARQVVPMYDQEFSNVWHGLKQENSPLHDIMVIRLNNSVTFTTEKLLSEYSSYSRVKAGPIKTEIAKPNEHLDINMKFVSVGYRTRHDIWKWCCLFRTVHEGDYVERNCGKWLPKEWGHFICIDNINDYPGIGSGAMLVSNKKVYGVGSFMIKRGGKSVFVFTDVRHYYDLVFKSCSWLDQDLGMTTTTTTTVATTAAV